MPSVRVEVPGKLVLMGEYAVLDGAPAFSLAVRHGVAVVREDGPHHVETPDGDTRFVDAALAGASGRYRFTALEPFDLPEKPGMGGSGAAVVAALLAAGAANDPVSLTRTGIAIHRRVQGGGSGIDVATSAHGHGIRFQADRATPVALPTPIVVWSGASAKTGPRVKLYRQAAGRERFVEASTELVERFTAEPVETTRQAYRLLCAMASRAGFTYTTPAIEAIVALAEEAGGAAKPSGAGGGDVVVAWGGPDVTEAFTRAGLRVLPIQVAGPPAVIPL